MTTPRIYRWHGTDYINITDRASGIAYLTRCADRNGTHWYQGRPWPDVESCPTCRGTNDAGWLHVPGGRYGSTSAECAPVAWRIAYLLSKHGGEPITLDNLDHAMSMVVNSHDDVAYIVRTYGHRHYT